MKSAFLNRLRQEKSLTPSALRLYYLLDTKGIQLSITLVVAKQDPGGRLENPQPYRIQASHLQQAPAFLDESDVAILQLLIQNANEQAQESRQENTYLSHRNLSPDWCQRLLSTGRVKWAENQHTIESAPSKPLVVHWETSDTGKQSLGWKSNPNETFICLSQPCFFNHQSHQLGIFDNPYPPEALDILVQKPALEAFEVMEFIAQFGEQYKTLGLPLPKTFETLKRQGEPKPLLRLHSDTSTVRDFISLNFDYRHEQHSSCVSFIDEADTLSFLQGTNTCISLKRDKTEEANYWQYLQSHLTPYSPTIEVSGQLSFANRQHWQQVMLEGLPALKKQGWQVEIAPHFRFKFVEAKTITASMRAQESSWFDFALSVELDGESLPLMPLLISATRRFSQEQLQDMPANAPIDFELEDGRTLVIPAERVALWFSVLVELEELDDTAAEIEHLKLPADQIARIVGLQTDSALQWQDPDAVAEEHRCITQIPPLQALTLPPELQAHLRDYQRLGVAWLQQRTDLGFGGILADDMGLGKTLQTLSHLAVEKHQGKLTAPALIIAPRSLMKNWLNEAEKFVPHFRCMIMHGSKRHALWPALADCDLVITSYHCVLNDLDQWQQQSLHSLVLDEAHTIKNTQAKITRAIKQLDADSKLCLTGTPMENHLGELWSLFDFIYPGLLGSEKTFNRRYRTPIEREANQGRAASLLQTITPFMLRRKKQDVAKDLPPKSEIVLRLPLEKEQRDIYETLRLSTLEEISGKIQETGEAQSRVIILNALMQLRQACCDPLLVSSDNPTQKLPSAKRQRLLSMVEELIDEGRSILVFSQFTRMLDLIAADLKAQKIRHLMLTGKTRNRDELVQQFQGGERQVFLISLKAGGTGLTLTKADTVIHYDPWWNSSAEQQASDRAYRIGQDKPVFVYKLIAEDTIEEKIQTLQEEKQGLLEQIYAAAEGGSQQLALDNSALLDLITS